MRLGGYCFTPSDTHQLHQICDKLDCYGLSTIIAPLGIDEMSDEDCAQFGEIANSLGIVIGEACMWENLMTPDLELRNKRISKFREILRKSEIMGCRTAVTLVGTRDPSEHPLAPHPYMFTEECKKEFREIVLRILDGLDLKTTKYIIEPWHNSFFYHPEDIRDFIDRVNHPSFGLHLDLMNLVSHDNFYDTTNLIIKTFNLLADKVYSVHLKDIRCDYTHMFLKWDEVYIGDGVMDYDTYLKHIATLPPDITCFCEHMASESDYAVCFSRLHHLAHKAGLRFLTRSDL